MTDFPWNNPTPPPEPPPKPLLTLADYVTFLDNYVRVRVTVASKTIGTFSVQDNGQNLDATDRLPDGRIIVFETVPGAPRTIDPMVTPQNLIGYILTQFKAGLL